VILQIIVLEWRYVMDKDKLLDVLSLLLDPPWDPNLSCPPITYDDIVSTMGEIVICVRDDDDKGNIMPTECGWIYYLIYNTNLRKYAVIIHDYGYDKETDDLMRCSSWNELLSLYDEMMPYRWYDENEIMALVRAEIDAMDGLYYRSSVPARIFLQKCSDYFENTHD